MYLLNSNPIKLFEKKKYAMHFSLIYTINSKRKQRTEKNPTKYELVFKCYNVASVVVFFPLNVRVLHAYGK